MDEITLQAKWSQITKDSLEKLDKAVNAKVARKTDDGEDFLCKDLLKDLGWTASRDKFERFITGERNVSCDDADISLLTT